MKIKNTKFNFLKNQIFFSIILAVINVTCKQQYIVFSEENNQSNNRFQSLISRYPNRFLLEEIPYNYNYNHHENENINTIVQCAHYGSGLFNRARYLQLQRFEIFYSVNEQTTMSVSYLSRGNIFIRSSITYFIYLDDIGVIIPFSEYGFTNHILIQSDFNSNHLKKFFLKFNRRINIQFLDWNIEQNISTLRFIYQDEENRTFDNANNILEYALIKDEENRFIRFELQNLENSPIESSFQLTDYHSNTIISELVQMYREGYELLSYSLFIEKNNIIYDVHCSLEFNSFHDCRVRIPTALDSTYYDAVEFFSRRIFNTDSVNTDHELFLNYKNAEYIIFQSRNTNIINGVINSSSEIQNMLPNENNISWQYHQPIRLWIEASFSNNDDQSYFVTFATFCMQNSLEEWDSTNFQTFPYEGQYPILPDTIMVPEEVFSWWDSLETRDSNTIYNQTLIEMAQEDPNQTLQEILRQQCLQSSDLCVWSEDEFNLIFEQEIE